MSLLALLVIPGEILQDPQFFMKALSSEIQSLQKAVSVLMEGMMSFDPKTPQTYMFLLFRRRISNYVGCMEVLLPSFRINFEQEFRCRS